MNKIKNLISSLFLLLKKPSLINLLLDSEYRWETYLKKQHKNINQLPTVDIRNLIEATSSLNHFTFLGGGSLPTDIILLKSLANQISNCRYFEIGTWRGESVINVS